MFIINFRFNMIGIFFIFRVYGSYVLKKRPSSDRCQNCLGVTSWFDFPRNSHVNRVSTTVTRSTLFIYFILPSRYKHVDRNAIYRRYLATREPETEPIYGGTGGGGRGGGGGHAGEYCRRGRNRFDVMMKT